MRSESTGQIRALKPTESGTTGFHLGTRRLESHGDILQCDGIRSTILPKLGVRPVVER
jgi:hypothetical protein